MDVNDRARQGRSGGRPDESALDLVDVLRGVGAHSLPLGAPQALAFSGVVHDSREVMPGSLFVALRGERDGHDFIPDAFRRGALGVIAERTVQTRAWLSEEDRPKFAYIVVGDSLTALQSLASWHLKRLSVGVVGITGSVGKTTTREVVAAVLGQRFRVLRNEKNFNNEIGLPLTLLRLTPWHQRAVLEMGMYNLGDIVALCAIAHPSIGAVTNVHPVHMERVGSVDGIAQAKSELVRALPANGWAILNADDPRVRSMRSVTQARALFYGLDQTADVWASHLETVGLEGLRFHLHRETEAVEVYCSLPGQHSVYACLAAAAVGTAEGMSLREIAQGLASIEQRPRLKTVPGSGGSIVIDDTYNASPLSVVASLELLGSLKGRRIAVLGDMYELGAYEEAGHREVGRKASQTLDELVVVGPRARWIGEEAQAGGLKNVRFLTANDEVDLVLRAGDYVLVKGSRGMRMEEVVERLRQGKEASH